MQYQDWGFSSQDQLFVIVQQGAPAEQDKFLTMMSHAQRGRMEEQHCLEPYRDHSLYPQTHHYYTLRSVLY